MPVGTCIDELLGPDSEVVDFRAGSESTATRALRDEPITVGPHAGQRSVRMNRACRAFYVLRVDGVGQLVEVVEVDRHVYNR